MHIPYSFRAIVLLACLSCSAVARVFCAPADSLLHILSPDTAAYDALHIPAHFPLRSGRPIVVAIVDDAFSFTHRDLRRYFYHNPAEIAGNGKDDDHNGYIDDVSGWDVADGDNDASIPDGRTSELTHGSMVMGIVVEVAERCFGDAAADHIRIMPVKACPDAPPHTGPEYGYEGIQYAVNAGADIIICAWHGAYNRSKYPDVFDEAAKKGIAVIGLAGDFMSEQVDPPASARTVFTVTALDAAFHKIKTANYGRKIDLALQADHVYAPHPAGTNTYTYASGTDAAAALAGGCAAVLRAISPSSGPDEIFSALKNTAIPVDSLNNHLTAKLGAGRPDMTAAIAYLQMKEGRDIFFDGKRTQGEILIDKATKRQSWQIKPDGGFTGIRFRILQNPQASKSAHFDFYAGDSLYESHDMKDFPASLSIPGGNVRVVYKGGRSSKPLQISYSSDPIDSPKLYCKGTKNFSAPSGEFSDGSGSANYASDCDCKWLITVPAGKRIRLDFDEFDTEAKTDFVYVYQGSETLPKNLIARFSGPDLPPIVTSGSNQVLIWFLTDGRNTAKGWHLRYTATDDPPGKTLR